MKFQDGSRSDIMTSFLRYTTSLFNVSDFQGNIFGHAINPSSFIFMALMLFELQGEELKRQKAKKSLVLTPKLVETLIVNRLTTITPATKFSHHDHKLFSKSAVK